MIGGKKTIRYNVNKKHGCVDQLIVNGENLASLLGFHEYAEARIGGMKHYKQTEADVKVVGDKTEGKMGRVEFVTTVEKLECEDFVLRFTFNRKWRKPDPLVFDDSVCFIFDASWIKNIAIKSAKDLYYPWFTVGDVQVFSMAQSVAVQKGVVNGLFASGAVGGWAALWNDRVKVELKAVSAQTGFSSMHRVVEFRSKKFVEWEFEFDVSGSRHAGVENVLVVDMTVKSLGGKQT